MILHKSYLSFSVIDIYIIINIIPKYFGLIITIWGSQSIGPYWMFVSLHKSRVQTSKQLINMIYLKIETNNKSSYLNITYIQKQINSV